MDLTQYKIRVLVRKEVHGRPKRERPHDIIGTVLSINPNNARTSKALDDELNIPNILCGIYADETYEADIMVRWDNDEKGEVWPGSILLVSTTIPICESLWGKGELNRAPRKFVENELKPRTGKKVCLKVPSKNTWLEFSDPKYITIPKKDLEHLSDAISGITTSYGKISNTSYTNYTAEIPREVEPEPVPAPRLGRNREEKRAAFAYNYGGPIQEGDIKQQLHRTQRKEVGSIRYNPQGRFATKIVKRPDGSYKEIRINDIDMAQDVRPPEEYEYRYTNKGTERELRDHSIDEYRNVYEKKYASKRIHRENPFKPDVRSYHGDRPVNNNISAIPEITLITKIDKRLNEDDTMTTTTRLIDPISNETLHTAMEVVPNEAVAEQRSFAKIEERYKDFTGTITGRSKSKSRSIFDAPRTKIDTRRFIDTDEEIEF